MLLAFFHLRSRSLLRGTLLVLASLALALVLSGFPHPRPTWYVAIPALTALWGTWETLRCLRLRWSFYHGGVLMLLYMDVMAIAMIFFLLLYPYAGSYFSRVE
ncbi:permease [Silvibacterium dinghuense]|uniref:Permease n=1 Tax=Silvibacterium dinghuense TaxID=1560006 RepID=A0A4V1NV98_9BACT|nr:permease [Silvibacterium dinghuense]RXS95020.1 permease [Silvibacterium dinghuense]GGH09928.1 hypothetical protein GCM10011586_28050 [Silvibacterium dinghuense]